MNRYKVIDNFLDKKFYDDLKNILYSPDIPWYFRDSYTGHPDANESHYFTHNFYNSNQPYSPMYESWIVPILKKLKSVAPIQIRANLLFDIGRPTASAFHVDETVNCKTAILYFATCDAPTILDPIKKIQIDAIENRIVIFDSNVMHSGTVNKIDKRIVLNMNYFDQGGLLDEN